MAGYFGSHARPNDEIDVAPTRLSEKLREHKFIAKTKHGYTLTGKGYAWMQTKLWHLAPD